MNAELKKELLRKTCHLATGILFALLIYFGIAKWWHFLIILIVSLPFIYFIHNTNRKIPVISDIISIVGREKEFPGFGALTFVIGTMFTVILFPKDIASASILILGVGDAVSPLIGKHFGRTKTVFSERKMIEGFIFGVLLSTLAAAQIVGYKLAFFGSFVALFAEFWDGTDFIDDNILIPIVAGAMISLVSLAF